MKQTEKLSLWWITNYVTGYYDGPKAWVKSALASQYAVILAPGERLNSWRHQVVKEVQPAIKNKMFQQGFLSRNNNDNK